MAAFDVNRHVNPSQFKTAVRRVVNFAANAPDEVVEEGRNWYPAVHGAIARQAPGIGLDIRRGAGIVAAVSPGMDFEAHNINALDEIREIKPKHWAMIGASHEEARKNKSWNAQNRGAIARGEAEPLPTQRHDEVRSMLLETAPSLSRAADQQLLKAGRIMSGEHPEEVLNRRTAPKTNAFYHNLADPSGWDRVTIDGRQADIISNNLRTWSDSSRGISSAGLPSGGSTRYEDHEDVMRTATKRSHVVDSRMRGASPADLQAVTWVEGKRVEMAVPTKSGQPRKVGPHREGQKYTDLQRQAGR